MRSVLVLVVLVSACSEVRVAQDGAVPTDSSSFCSELYGHQVNAGGRLGIDRADWPCPTWVATEEDRDLCVDFLRMDAALECEVETCGECAP